METILAGNVVLQHVWDSGKDLGFVQCSTGIWFDISKYYSLHCSEQGVQGSWEGVGVVLGCVPESPSLFQAGVDLPPHSASSLVASRETSQTASQNRVSLAFHIPPEPLNTKNILLYMAFLATLLEERTSLLPPQATY